MGCRWQLESYLVVDEVPILQSAYCDEANESVQSGYRFFCAVEPKLRLGASSAQGASQL
jgi:hypothetical protein